MWAIIIVGILISFGYFGEVYLYTPGLLQYGIGIILFIYWMYFFLKGVGVNTAAARRPHHVGKLITHDVYSMVRHPLYSADIVLGMGILIVYPTIAMFVSIAWLITVMMVWIFLEEKSLKELFSEEYIEYTKKVPMIFPRARKRK